MQNNRSINRRRSGGSVQDQLTSKGRSNDLSSRLFPQSQEISPDYRGSGKLEGKTALIAGGENGISRSVAIHFAREGADIAIAFRGERSEAESAQRLVEAEGRRCLTLSGDISSREFCHQCVHVVAEEFGRLDILVNNGGRGPSEGQGLESLSERELERVLHEEIFSLFFMTQAALPRLDQDSCVINTVFEGAHRGAPLPLDQAVIAGATENFTRSLAKFLAPRRVRVNAVAPGAIWTQSTPLSFAPTELPHFGHETLLGRPGHPSEVAPAYVFLASSDSSYITGQIIHPNGGELRDA